MSNSDETDVTQPEGAEVKNSKNSEGWSITDVSHGSSSRIVISGCRHATGETFLSIFLVVASDPLSDAKYLYSREFSKNFNPKLSRLVSFYDELNLITCFDNLVEKISIVNDEVVKSNKMKHDGASCLYIKEKQTFIGFRESRDVVVLNSDLKKVKVITLSNLQSGWPMDLVMVKDSLFLCSIGCVPRRALSLAEKDGQLLKEYTNPRSDDSVPLSLTVSAEADLVAVLWNCPPQLTFHSVSNGHCLVVTDVEPAERIRSVGSDKLVMVDGNGEMKFFTFEEFFTFKNLKAILSTLLSHDDCKELMDFFGVSCYQVVRVNDRGIGAENDDEVNLRDLLQYFEDDGTIQLGDVSELIEAFTHLGKDKALISPLETYQKYAGRTGFTDNAPYSPILSGNTTNDISALTSEESALQQNMQDADKFVDNEFSSQEEDDDDDEDGDAQSWTSDGEPLSALTPDVSQGGKTSEWLQSAEGDFRSPQRQDNAFVTGNNDLRKVESTEIDGEAGEMEVSDEEDVIMEEEDLNCKVDDETAVEEAITMMMQEIQALKDQNGLILSYLRTQPSSYPWPHQHPPTDQYSVHSQSSLYPQTASLGHLGTQVKPFSQTNPLPMQQLPAVVKQSDALQQAGPSISAPPGPHHYSSQLAPAPASAQLSQPSAQNSVVSPPQISPPGQQAQPDQIPQSQTTPHMQQTSQPPQLSQSLPQASLVSQAQAGSSPPNPQSPLTKQPSSSIPSSQPTPPQPSIKSIAQPSQMGQSQPAHHVQPTHAPPLVNLPTHPQVPVYPHPPNLYGPSVRFSPHVYRQYYPLYPNFVRPPYPVQIPSSVATTVPVTTSTPLTSSSTAQLQQINTQSQTSAGTIAVTTHQPAHSNPTPATQTPGQTFPNGTGQSPVSLAMPSQVVTPMVSVIPHGGVGPSNNPPVINYSFETLPPVVKHDILPYTNHMHLINHRNAIVRILADYLFSDRERMECNCSGKNGYKPFNPEKLQIIRQVMFELCAKHSVGHPQLDQAVEWRRLCKVIDSHNRGHRIKIRSKLKESSF